MKLFNYLIARDENRQELRVAFAYARSELRVVKLGDHILDYAWEIEHDDYVRVVTSVFLLAMLELKHSSGVVQAAKGKMEKLDRKASMLEKWFPKIEHTFYDVKHMFKKTFTSKYELSELIKQESYRNKFAGIGLRLIEELVIDEDFTIDDCVQEKVFDFLPIDEFVAPEAFVPDVPKIQENVERDIPDGKHYPAVDQKEKIEIYEAQKQHQRLIDEIRSSGSKRDDALGRVLTEAAKNLEEHGPTKFEPSAFEGIFGVPGSGKSARTFNIKIPLHQASNPDTPILFIVPTNKLKEEFAKRLNAPNRVVTLHVAIHLLSTNKIKPSLIVVDECFMVPVPLLTFYSSFAKVLLLGDPQQIGHIDFQGFWPGMIKLAQLYKAIDHDFLLVSKRCPQDIVKHPFIASRYPGISSTSIKGSGSGDVGSPSINWVGPTFTQASAQLIVFTQEAKRIYQDQGAITVQDSQGGTFTSVILHVSCNDADKILSSHSAEHITVAMTRHTNNLFIREEQAGTLNNVINMHMGGHVELDIATKESNVALPKFATEKEFTFNAEQTIMETVPYSTAASTAQAVEQILAEVFPGVCEMHEYQQVEKTTIPYHHGASATIKVDPLHEDALLDSKTHCVYKFQAAQRVKSTKSARKVSAINTLFDRYTKKTKNLNPAGVHNEVKKLGNVLDYFLDWNVGPDEKEEAYADAITKFQERGHDVTDLRDIDCWTDQGINNVEFQMKQQQKATTSGDPLTKDKAGQGIAAWKKTLNFTMVIWSRLLEKVAMRAKKGFVFATGKTDTEMLQLLDYFCSDNNYEYMECDWTEFDSTQNNVEHALFMSCLEKIGCPSVLRRQFFAMMNKRTVSYDHATVQVENKKDSGRVDTLIGNTIFDAAVVLSCVNYTELEYAVFKGDDSTLIAKEIKINNTRIKELGIDCGYKLKIACGKSCEFTSFVMNENGAALNLPKIAAKVLTRAYANEIEFHKYRIAVEDLIKTTNSTEVAARMAQVNMAHYRVNEEKFDQIISFLHMFARGQIKFSELIKYENRVKTEGM
nr:MAG: RNA-dependent RNA polymerase [Chemarfal virus 9]